MHGEPKSSSSSEWLGEEGGFDTEEEDTDTSLWVIGKVRLVLELIDGNKIEAEGPHIL